MGTQLQTQTEAKSFSIQIEQTGSGSIAQVLHPTWIRRNNLFQMGQLLADIDKQISDKAPRIKLVLTAGGFIELWPNLNIEYKELTSEASLRKILDVVKKSMEPLLQIFAMANIQRDYVVGVDAVVNDKGAGQFAVAIVKGKIETIAWKSFPVMDENEFIAGYRSALGIKSPRITATSLGKTLLLVCHDAQAFNHRNQALVHKAHRKTQRSVVMQEMQDIVIREQPSVALDLVHYVGKRGSIKTFANSYKQLSTDFACHPTVVGAFGYDKPVRKDLKDIATRAQYPEGSAGCMIVVSII